MRSAFHHFRQRLDALHWKSLIPVMSRRVLASAAKWATSGKRWRLAATICRAAIFVDRRAVWHYRLGWVLERAHDADGAVKAYRTAIAQRPDKARWHYRLGSALHMTKNWAAAADAYRTAIAHRPEKAKWHYRLGSALQRSNDWAAAADAYRTAISHDSSKADWFHRWGVVSEKLKDFPSAAEAYHRGLAADGSRPCWRYRLASAYSQVGQWKDSARELEANITQHPDHAASYRLLAQVESSVLRWGGVFEGGLDHASKTTFRPTPPRADADGPYTHAVTAMKTAVRLRPQSATWRFELARLYHRNGELDRAITTYEGALALLDQADGRWVFKARQPWQFQLELAYHQAGAARVTDPLFDCAVELRSDSNHPGDAAGVVGLFDCAWVCTGLRISGLCVTNEASTVDLELNGTQLKRINVAKSSFFPRFNFFVKRSTLDRFPAESQLNVRTAEGKALRPSQANSLRLRVPHGDGRILDILRQGGALDKKGTIQPTKAEVRKKQFAYLDLYSQVRDFFEDELERPLFLLYGTLLGYQREGDLIPGDDDFDVGYVSRETDPVAVKEEAKHIITLLVRAGYIVRFNRRGRLCRVQLEAGLHLDLRPVWFQDGKAWLHKHACLSATIDDFLPAEVGTLHGRRVYIPRQPEVFLRENYGPGWVTPDPGYVNYASAIDDEVLQNLSKLLMTPGEYKELKAALERDPGNTAPMGRFESVGSLDLYPLSSATTD